MSGFTKLFESILDSTIWLAPDQTRIVWITMLAMADRHGIVEGSIPGLANRAHVSLDAAKAALEAFQKPDPFSRTQEFEGRRITNIQGGWLILNYAEYRKMRDEEDRRNQCAQAKARQREREELAGKGNESDDGHQMSSMDCKMSSGLVKSDDSQPSASASASVSEKGTGDTGGTGGEGEEGNSCRAKRIPSLQDWLAEASRHHPDWPESDVAQSWEYYESISWMRGKTPVSKWKLCISTCYRNWLKYHPKSASRDNPALECKTSLADLDVP